MRVRVCEYWVSRGGLGSWNGLCMYASVRTSCMAIFRIPGDRGSCEFDRESETVTVHTHARMCWAIWKSRSLGALARVSL
jgi:hypothetical protein